MESCTPNISWATTNGRHSDSGETGIISFNDSPDNKNLGCVNDLKRFLANLLNFSFIVDPKSLAVDCEK